MEAIKPGSSANIRPSFSLSHELVSSVNHESAPSSYVEHNVQGPPSSLRDSVIYDELDTIISIPQVPYPTKQATNREYDEPIMLDPSARPVPLPTIEPPTQGESEETKFSLNVDDDANNSDNDIYVALPQELYDNIDSDLVENVETSPSLRRNITVPREIESVSEVTLESLTTLDAKEAQLWMLLQMQKMVQKMEDIYDMPQRPNPKPKTRPPSSYYNISKAFPPSSPMSEEEYVDMDSQPPRQDIYMNLDTISEVLIETTPPIPPRTYHPTSSAREEIVFSRERTQSESQSFQDDSGQGNQCSESFPINQISQTAGISTEDHAPMHHDHLPSHDATVQQAHAAVTSIQI